jgi:indole-3-glycerol phosphate synthase
MSAGPMGVLAKILARKRGEVADLERSSLAPRLAEVARQAPPPRDFLAALRGPGRVPVIAEIKRRSPSAGELAGLVAPGERARQYEAGGAAAISVLTDGPYFGGSLDDLAQARRAVELPILRKDFILEPLQVCQARAAGADAVLLIVAALDEPKLHELYGCCLDWGMQALLEVHGEEELETALRLNPPLIGINNRDLVSLQVDLNTSLALRPLIDDGVLVVAESGVSGPDDVRRLLAGGLNAFLVGSRLMQAEDPVAALSQLVKAAG